MLRILPGADLDALGAKLASLEADPMAGPVTAEALPLLRRLFGEPKAHGVAMAVRASVGVEAPATTTGSCVALANDLLKVWEQAAIR